MNGTPRIPPQPGGHGADDDGLFSDRPPPGLRRVVYYALLVAPCVLVFPYLEWIGSLRGEWWLEGLFGELLLLPMCAVPLMIGTGAGIFAPKRTGRTAAALGYGLLCCGLPALWVAGYHLVTVPWAEAPGTWPAYADWALRAALCAAFGLLLIPLLSRRARLAPLRLAGLFAVLLLTIWPWLGGWIPLSAALGMLMAIGVCARASGTGGS